MNQTDLTLTQYREQTNKCKQLFEKKNKDYGTAWRILRPSSITDQILIKALRIRSIEEKGVNKVGESIEDEFIGIYNYCIIGLIQLQYWDTDKQFSEQETVELYIEQLNSTEQLMLQKNHDYGEAWREMRQESFADLILAKLLRIKQILLNGGKTIASEGIDANFFDILNYAVFALILVEEGKH